MEELLAEERVGEMGLEHVRIGESETETKLHRIAEEIEPTLKHKTYFRTKNRNELITELTEATRMPGVSPIMTQPIRNRVDMLATGIQTPIGIKVFGKDLAKIEEIAVRIEQELLKLEGAQVPMLSVSEISRTSNFTLTGRRQHATASKSEQSNRSS